MKEERCFFLSALGQPNTTGENDKIAKLLLLKIMILNRSCRFKGLHCWEGNIGKVFLLNITLWKQNEAQW